VTNSPLSVTTCNPVTWRRESSQLLEQQLWALGCDIRRPEGNLLIAAGCKRLAAPANLECASCYKAICRSGARLSLRGFGLVCEHGSLGALFISRDNFTPQWTPRTSSDWSPWRLEDVAGWRAKPSSHAAEVSILAAAAAEWLAQYETGVVELLGPEYRQSTLDQRQRSCMAPIGGAEMASRWSQIAEDLRLRPDLLGISEPPHRGGRRRKAARPLTPATVGPLTSGLPFSVAKS
jgi:hypothetical protein